MSDYRAPLDDLCFVMFDVLRLPEFWAGLPGHEDMDAVTARAVLEEAGKLCEQEIAPLNRPADEQGCTWSEQGVTAPAGFKEAWEALCGGGWVGLGGNPQYEGAGMPKSLAAGVEEMIQGACMSFGLAPMLTSGACLALDEHGSEALKQAYLPKLYSGEWAGAMDLTEPHAGTDLGLIRTRAEPAEDGSYRLTGTKIFITWGEHDMAQNIVHLVLARLPDAPAGSRGISMFLVPKFLPDDAGNPGQRNAVHCGALEKKMGIKGSATCVMNYDGATGWMVGKPNKGLAAMFTMMNYERLVVGIQAVGVAEASAQSANAYARERLQSRAARESERTAAVADPIIAQPDVRRMLMDIKAHTDASRAFYLYVAQWLDAARYSAAEREQQTAADRVALLTPVAKAFLTDVAFDTAVAGQQVLGGHGYIRESGQEQHVRDIRITQIYEGTNGIQAMDLIGRKTIACGGGLLNGFCDEVRQFAESEQAELSALGLHEPLVKALQSLLDATAQIIRRAEHDPCVAGAVANDYLHSLGLLGFAYMWARMAVTAKAGGERPDKVKTAQYFFACHLPRLYWLIEKMQQPSELLMGLDEEAF